MLNAVSEKSNVMVFDSGAVQVTNVDVPVRLPDGTVCGKARVIEGRTDDATILVELEWDNPLVTKFFKSGLYEISLATDERSVNV